MSPYLEITWLGNKFLTAAMESRAVWQHVVLQSTAPLQLKPFKVGSKRAIAASAPVLQNQKKNVAKSPDSLTHPV